MKKLLLLFLLVAGGVSTASATISTLEFHFNYNADWSGANSYPSFTKIGTNPDNTNETIYEFVLNSTKGLGSNDVFFRLHPTGWANDIGPGSNVNMSFEDAILSDYNQWHGEASWSNTNYYRIPQSTIKASEYLIRVYAQEDNHYYIQVYIEKMPVTIGSTGKATFCCNRALDFTDTGISAYTIITSNKATGVLTTSDALTTVPANTGLYLEGTAKTYDVPVLESASSVGTNMLVGVLSDTPISQTATVSETEYTNYILTINTVNGSVATPKFYKVNGEEGNTVLAGKAYLQIRTEDAARESFWFDEDVTAIEKNVSPALNESAVYDLQGRKVMNPAKGLYIVNGKKVIK